jgi:hydrogenase expression/formation protein HypC
MCLAVPGLIVKIEGNRAEADFGGGVLRTALMDFMPGAKAGDYILVHAGYAIQILNPSDAKALITDLKEIYGS